MRALARLYKSCKIIPSKNFCVEGIANYLETLEYLEYEINYFKFDSLEPTLKLPLRQESLEMINFNDYNYIVIQNLDNSGSRPYAYFIQDKKWKSENCIELELYLDSVNTFGFNQDYIISDKTKVLREHRDRYVNLEATKVIVDNNYGVKCNLYWIDLQEWHGEVTLLPNPDLIGLINYRIEVEGNGTATLDTSTGVITLTARGGTYDGEIVYIYYKVIAIYGRQLVKNIDDFPEGLNPQLFRGEENEITQPFNTSWNLIYKNRDNIEPSEINQINPVECFVCPDESHKVKSATSTSIGYSALQEGQFYCISPSNNSNAELRFRDNQGHIYNLTSNRTYNYGYTTESISWIVLARGSGEAFFTIYLHSYAKTYHGNIVDYYYNQISYTATNITTLEVLNSIPIVNYATSNADNFPEFIPTISGSFNFTIQDKYLLSLSSLDRTDSKLIKIIKLPYCPSITEITASGDLALDSNWTYNEATGFFKLNDLNTKFNYTFEAPFTSPLMTLADVPSNFDTSRNRRIEYETKLLNSEFYYPKFVYDSFGFNFNLEAVDIIKYLINKTNPNFKVGFVMTTTINSKFMFYFPDYALKDYKKLQDYDNVLPISRNNEVVLYNNQYINYLRTGYNYDLKNKNRAETTSGITTALGIVGAIASIGLGVSSGNPAVAVSGVVGGIATATSSIVSNVNTIASQESAMASKLEQLKAQSTSVNGSDDIDLLEAYSNNRAKLTEYRVSDRMRRALFDLFYYCGYATNEMKVPDLHSRYWFNYIQAELEINATSNLPKFVEDDLVNRFKEGLTILHGRIVNNTLTWDFEQEKENWEISLIGGIN